MAETINPLMHSFSNWLSTLKKLQYWLQNLYSVFDHFGTICFKGLRVFPEMHQFMYCFYLPLIDSLLKINVGKTLTLTSIEIHCLETFNFYLGLSCYMFYIMLFLGLSPIVSDKFLNLFL